MPTDAPSPYVVLDGTVRHLDPKARLDFLFDRAVVLTVLLVVGIAGSLAAGSALAAVVAIIVAVTWMGLLVWVARLWWTRFTWQAQPEALELQHGVLVKRKSYVPYHRIQQIDLRQRPVQRMLGLSTLVLRTAAATTDAELPGVAAADADALRQEFLHRAGLDDAV